ncbi:hypothetical protein KSX_26880 [Ktedonospora formicarum]|uniref:Uncharacterized protein n=1 Tax=Ktedonospora formicarum TaxID=2778364 RepID=A0A8J3MTM1_9CHLR|nr:hypothetical protein KSX_26880 [Ktedonospora formicarum]
MDYDINAPVCIGDTVLYNYHYEWDSYVGDDIYGNPIYEHVVEDHQSVGLVVSLPDQDTATLFFTTGTSMGSAVNVTRGTGPGQWRPREQQGNVPVIQPA